MDALLERLDRLIAVREATLRERSLAKVTKWLAGKMRKFFLAQRKEFFAALPPPRIVEAEGDQLVFPEWSAAWAAADKKTRAMFEESIREGVAISLQAGVKVATANLNPSFVLDQTQALEYARSHAAELVTKVNDTTKGILNGIVTRGIDEGKSYGQIAKEISDRFGDFAVSWPQEHIQNRAHAVAVYETGDAFEAGNRMVADQMAASGLPMEKSWHTVGDDRVRDAHRENAAAGWIPLDQSFPSGDDRAPSDPGCRCNTQYQVAGAEAA